MQEVIGSTPLCSTNRKPADYSAGFAFYVIHSQRFWIISYYIPP